MFSVRFDGDNFFLRIKDFNVVNGKPRYPVEDITEPANENNLTTGAGQHTSVLHSINSFSIRSYTFEQNKVTSIF